MVMHGGPGRWAGHQALRSDFPGKEGNGNGHGEAGRWGQRALIDVRPHCV
jgi:hypothetical protein